MIRYLLSILIVLCASYTFAQNAKIDSLKALLPKTQGADRVDLCRELAINMFGIDKQTSFDFAKEGLRLATDIGDSARMIKVAKTVTAILRRFEKYDSAIILGNYIEKIAHRNYFNSVDHGDILNGLAMNYIYLSQYDMAISYLQNARSAFEESDDLNGLFAVLNNIGLTYYKFQNPELALVYYKRSLKLSKSINNKSYADTLSLPINISLCYMALDSLKKARSIIQPILEKCPSKCSDNEFALALSGSAVIFYHSDSLQKAEKEFLRAYAFAKKINHHRFLFDAIIYLAKIYLKRGDLTSAEQFLMEGNTLTTQNHFDLEEMKVYKELIALFRARDEIRKLPFYQAKYIQLNDSIFNEAKTNNLMRLHAEDREKEYKTQLAAQERTVRLKDEIITKQLGINILIGVACIFLSVLIYMLVNVFNARKRANALLIEKVKDRTVELQRNRLELLTAIERQDTVLTQLRETFSTSVKSMHELCSLEINEGSNTGDHHYFREIAGITRSISTSLESNLTIPD